MSAEAITQKLFEGRWDDNVAWEFYLTDSLPPAYLCTAVFCLAIIESTEQIVLTRGKRGWEMLGGHIEPGETIGRALEREALEEGGFYASSYTPYGYRKIIANVPVVNEHHGGVYPPVSYIPHFLATTDRPLVQPTAPPEEIFESRAFDEAELAGLEIALEPIALVGLQQYRMLNQRP